MFFPYLKTPLVWPSTSVHNVLKSLANKLSEIAIESQNPLVIMVKISVPSIPKGVLGLTSYSSVHNVPKSLAAKLAESAIESHIGVAKTWLFLGRFWPLTTISESLSGNGQNWVFLPYLRTFMVWPATSVHNILKSLTAKLAESALESYIGLGTNLCGKCLKHNLRIPKW